MIYKDYGRTGIKASAVGFGGMRFDEEKSNEKNAELLLYAKDKGINYFDTAPMYGEGMAERALGKFLSHGVRHRVTLTTKIGMPARSFFEVVPQAMLVGASYPGTNLL